MADLPVMLRVQGRRCVIVGGGSVALRRAGALIECGAEVTVIAPQISAELAARVQHVERRAYREGDVVGALLVVIATDQLTVNEQVMADARRHGVLVNRTDDSEAGDMVVPAHRRIGPITLAVHTGGVSAAAGAVIRDQLAEALDPDWPRLLEIAAPWRDKVQQQVRDPVQRRRLLLALTDEQAMDTLRRLGSDGLQRRLRALLDTARPVDTEDGKDQS